MLHLSNNLKEKKRNINIDLAVLPSHDTPVETLVNPPFSPVKIPL